MVPPWPPLTSFFMRGVCRYAAASILAMLRGKCAPEAAQHEVMRR